MTEPRIQDLLRSGVKAINIGVPDFAATLEAQGIAVVHVDWRPPADGDREMMGLLDKLL
ncbi:MAG: fdrA domain protein [Chloroflexi bacterium]|nr:fdrA domain protein [Chloroflexota bacterium]